jgi:hypothetical protein
MSPQYGLFFFIPKDYPLEAMMSPPVPWNQPYLIPGALGDGLQFPWMDFIRTLFTAWTA